MTSLSNVPVLRIRRVNDAPPAEHGQYVLYWMVAARRLEWNFALQHAVHWAEQLGRPLVVLEALRAGYPWASPRLHRFVLDGMAEKRARLTAGDVFYYPYVEPHPGAGRGLLEALAANACVVVTDETPTFFLPRMIEAAGRKVGAALEAVDSNGLLPLAATDRDYPSAYMFRRFLQRNLADHLDEVPQPDPLSGLPPAPRSPIATEITGRWPPPDAARLEAGEILENLPIDHDVVATPLRGGAGAAAAKLDAFVAGRLRRYDDDRKRPFGHATSELSPYLHFGHISSHQVFRAVADSEAWSLDELGDATRGHRRGWWGMSENAEAFLDQLVTWRELGFNMCAHREHFDRYESLPDWARKTLDEHRNDPREHTYSLEDFEGAATHDELWNAAQRQLLREGVIHNYLRMLWGKKILQWSSTPEDALRVMIELNNKYALDGRDPNSYSGIFWVLGRYDRAWGPERPVFGKIRYISSGNTVRKLPVRGYLDRYAATESNDPWEAVPC